MPKPKPKPPAGADLDRIAREKFGYDGLRPGQEETIRHVLAGRDTLLVMPTGAGKSAIYQIAGLFIDGPTVVVSPLIALQRDQVSSIEAQAVAPAVVVNSTVPAADRRDAFARLEDGSLEYVFVAPEQLTNADTLDRVRGAGVRLFVVDEAHCVSEWGHDFRPDYLRLGAIIESLGHPVVLAMTATASPSVREDIMTRLGMRDPRVVVRGFDRPSIRMGVLPCPTEAGKQKVLLDRVAKAARPGIVYAATRGHAEEVAKLLADNGHPAVHYHAGMKAAERHAVQEAFMAGREPIIVATNAFGMGVDKPDVRFVIHYDIPESIDAYYQEIGRAARDGNPADAVLLYREEDVGLRRAMAAGGKLHAEEAELVAEALRGRTGPAEIKELQEETELSKAKVTRAVHRLEDAGVVELLPTGEVTPAPRGLDVAGAAEDAAREHEEHRAHNLGRVEIMKDYAETRDCRRRFLLNYFGEQYDEPCGHCDNCEAGIVPRSCPDEARDLPFPLKTRVTHKTLGAGVVMRYEGEKVVILFDRGGYKGLVIDYVVKNGLVEREPSEPSPPGRGQGEGTRG